MTPTSPLPPGGPLTVSPYAMVMVDYVDYGNREQLTLSNLRPLEPQFCQLPCQSLLCSLSGLQAMPHPFFTLPTFRNVSHQHVRMYTPSKVT